MKSGAPLALERHSSRAIAAQRSGPSDIVTGANVWPRVHLRNRALDHMLCVLCVTRNINTGTDLPFAMLVDRLSVGRSGREVVSGSARMRAAAAFSIGISRRVRQCMHQGRLAVTTTETDRER